MIGKYRIEVYDNHISYKFEVKRNITVIQGNSASGKTELVRLISDYNRSGASSGVTLLCEKECVALNVMDWENYIRQAHEKIIFIDENNTYVKTQRFAEAVQYSDNYFVLIYRDSLHQLSYSVDEIYGIREARDSQKYVNIRPVYNELYKLYNLMKPGPVRPDLVITEDTNAGYECFKAIFSCPCVFAGGKTKVAKWMSEAGKEVGKILIIVDGAAFGADIQEVMRKIRSFNTDCVLYAPESFEFLLLKSGILDVNEDVLEHTYQYADSKTYLSWERFYTAYLIEKSENTIYHYKKEKLNQAYLSKRNLKMIAAQMPELIETGQ